MATVSGAVLRMIHSSIPSQGARLWAASLACPPRRPKVSRFATGVLPLAAPKEWGGQETRPTTSKTRGAACRQAASDDGGSHRGSNGHRAPGRRGRQNVHWPHPPQEKMFILMALFQYPGWLGKVDPNLPTRRISRWITCALMHAIPSSCIEPLLRPKERRPRK